MQLLPIRVKISLINTHKQRQRFDDVIVVDGMSSRYTIVINTSNCDISRKIRAVETRNELQEQLNMEISKVLLNKRGIIIDNNNRHLLICRIIVWENCNTGVTYGMLKHAPGYDQLSIDGFISVGAQRSDDVFNSFGIAYAYYLELQDAYFFKSKRKLMSSDTFKTKYYDCRKYLQNIHNGTIENMKLYIRQYHPKLSFSSYKFDSNSMILVTNSYIRSTPGDRISICIY